MSEIAERFRRLSADFTARVTAVPADRWTNPSPCEGWTARDVAGHLIGNVGFFFNLVGKEPPAGPSGEDDPVEAWLTARDALQSALDDPDAAGPEYDSQAMGGRGTFEQAVDRFGNLDVLVHTWDLARAAGLDERLDPDEVHRAFQAVLPMDAMLRSPGACGPKLEALPGADEQTRFLAFLGRRA
ncbi:MAG: TIGR03086 family metal-binding protein [Acidimicrobiales bacterium]